MAVLVVQEAGADVAAQSTPVQAVRVALPRAARAAAAEVPTAEETYSRPMRAASVAQAIPVRLM
jgi:hypothetical protein